MFQALIVWVAAAAYAEGDPLYAKMQGSWIGTGERIEQTSGRRTRIDTAVSAVIGPDGSLHSHNEITETPEDAPADPAHYVRDYTVTRTASGYEFDSIGASAVSHATFDGSTLTVVEDLGGGEPSYRIQSTTHFSADGSSDYDEEFLHGQNRLSVASIHYITRELQPSPR